MNQTQIRYLDKRMQEQRMLLKDEISKKAAEKKKRVTEKFRKEFEQAYLRALSTLPKEELVERLSWVFKEGIESIDGYYSWSRGIFNISPDNSNNYHRPDLVIEIDGLVAEWNQKAVALIDELANEKEDLISKLNVDMDALRDKLNLEGCDQAVKLLGDLVALWTATLESIGKADEPRPRRRK